ncbi:MAG: alpha/beta hydrolase [Bacteroidota bacterium]
MQKIYPLLLLLLCPLLSISQSPNDQQLLLGWWEGAFIKANSYQKIELNFTQKDQEVFGFQVMEEWHPSFGEFQVPVQIDSTGTIRLTTGYGKAELKLDKNNLELLGQITDVSPIIYLHLKKVPPKPTPNYRIEEVSINSRGAKIAGHLHIPQNSQHHTAIIIVGGRGCYPSEPQYDLNAKFLREYGVSVLAYQKRGTGQSTGDCATASIQNLATDLKNVKEFLASHPNNYQKIGVLGASAGGWTMTKAQEMTDFDFMISIVGPSTSVKEQQLQSMDYGSEFFNLEPQALQNLETYTKLMLEADATEETFAQMNALLANAEQEGWKQLLEDTDVSSSVEGLNNLWVRRHAYAPKNVLMTYDKPFLAIYGEKDWIVPHEENIQLLEECFANRKDQLTTLVVHGAGHGMETEAEWINLDPNRSYWRFFRISPALRIAMIDFLHKHNLIKQ